MEDASWELEARRLVAGALAGAERGAALEEEEPDEARRLFRGAAMVLRAVGSPAALLHQASLLEARAARLASSCQPCHHLFLASDLRQVRSVVGAGRRLGTALAARHSPLVAALCRLLRFAARADASSSHQAEPLVPAMLHLPADTQRFDLPDSPDGGFEAAVAAPAVFRHLRLLWGAKLAASLESETLYQLGSPGKSGACMFFTDDMRFIIKTVGAEEFHAFDPVSYYHHMMTHRDSLLNRMLVLASMSRSSLQPASPLRRWLGQEDDHVYLIVIENVVPPHLTVGEMYDLKGSTLGRAAGPDAKERARQSGKSIILKDLDVERCIHLTRDMGILLLDTLRADLAWLEQHHAMDYSLLLAVVPDEEFGGQGDEKGDYGAESVCCTCCGGQSHPRTMCNKCNLAVCRPCLKVERGIARCHLCQGAQKCPILGKEPPLSAESVRRQSVGSNVSASIFRIDDGGLRSLTPDGRARPERYYMAIIDYMQPFNNRKRVESTVKTYLLAGGDAMQISVLEPPLYASRMLEFVRRLISPIILPADLKQQ